MIFKDILDSLQEGYILVIDNLEKRIILQKGLIEKNITPSQFECLRSRKLIFWSTTDVKLRKAVWKYSVSLRGAVK